MASPIRGSKPYSNVHVGASITPSRLMNSCTPMPPTIHLRSRGPTAGSLPRRVSPPLFLQRDQPPGVPPLALTGERTLPDVPEENYWYRRHLAVYEWIARRVPGRRVVDLACGEGYG